MNISVIVKQAEEVLKHNDLGDWTGPAPGVYRHQWLWDSCFAAMGWAHIDIDRAQREIFSLLRGQWRNGMMPHMIFSETNGNSKHLPKMWDSRVSPFAPTDVATSGITQPPMLAQAVHYIGQQMEKSDRVQFYKRVAPHIIAYHQWLYEDRDPHHEGLVMLIHPWETGLDNTPPWVIAMEKHSRPLWIKLIEFSRADKLIERLRRDTRQMPIDERASTIESLMLYHVTRRLRRKNYDTSQILRRSHFMIEDAFYNSLLIRGNTLLIEIAKEARMPIPSILKSNMNKASKSFDSLWDEHTNQYYNRYFISREMIREPTIATVTSIYSGCLTEPRIEKILENLQRHDMFGTEYPVPSVPVSSKYFHHRRYWQGPVWLNTNWMIADGLMRAGRKEEAEKIIHKSLELIHKAGFHEYFSPNDGYGAGVEPFSWTAAMTIVMSNMLKDSPKK